MSIMDNRYNPLSNIPSMSVRHMIMQVLAWMWCIIFSIYVGSFVVFGISAIAHILLIAGLFITAITFKLAKELNIKHLYVASNKFTNEADENAIKEFCEKYKLDSKKPIVTWATQYGYAYLKDKKHKNK